jgi:hypothetical protein
VRWRTSDGDQEVTFNLRPTEVKSVWTMQRAFDELQRRIASWQTGPPTSEPEPSGVESLPLPPAGAVTSTSLGAARNLRQILNIVMFSALLSGLAAALLNLPIEWISPMYLAQDTGGYATISGWYAVLISVLMVILRFGPVWFSRQDDSPVPEAAPPPPIPAGRPDPSDVR